MVVNQLRPIRSGHRLPASFPAAILGFLPSGRVRAVAGGFPTG